MASGAVALVFASVAVDEPLTDWLAVNLGWTFRGEAEAASAVMEVIAGSMITIAGVVFSMTLVALSLASSQLGPRLLRTFMRDTSTQVVLGTFIATFVYCLLVLRLIRRAEEVEFVPNLSVSLGVLLAVASVGVLIYFIHHVSVSIQANEIAGRIGKELIQKIDQLFPEEIGQEGQPGKTDLSNVKFIEAFDRDAKPVAADKDGYLQSIDGGALLALAMEKDFVVRLQRKPGNYIVAGLPLLLISPGSRVTDDLAKEVNSYFVMGDQRTTGQDIEFSVNQLVEMAVRAQSTGLNDPFTAIACVDLLGSALCRLAARDMPSPFRHDCRNQLRLIARADTFVDFVDAAFNQIRQYSRSSAAVTIRLLETIAVIAEFVHRPEDRAILLLHARMIAQGAKEELPEKEDRRVVEELWQAVIELYSEPTENLR
ncbi:putative membrane protein [Natronocella acetinitrilica]|uniref:Membrane protein n=2 Tax=Natronocella acetinitrilica TaxID=414046 RepID=A0AAE3G7V5_9GAMM|nr:putative membrane protein [Natronocella acetinitrilica]